MTLLFLLMAASLDAEHKSASAKLAIRGPLTASTGQPLPIHLEFENISADQTITIDTECKTTNPTWDIRNRNGKKAFHSPVEIDCLGAPIDLKPGTQHEWTLDPSYSYRFPETGIYFLTATFSYTLRNPQPKTENPQTVISNTITINIR